MTKGFNSDLHKACSTDALRDAMNHVFIKDGFALATDGTIAVKQHLSLHDFDEKEIQIMEGKFIHREIIKNIRSTGDFVLATEEGLRVTPKKSPPVVYPWSIADGKFPDIDFVLNRLDELSGNCTDHLGIDPKYLLMVYDAMPLDFRVGVRLHFAKPNKVILVEPIGFDRKQIAVIMPVAINDYSTQGRGFDHPLLKRKETDNV